MSEIDNKSWDKLSDLIQNNQTILLSTHINADGDGLGSEIAFYYYLKSVDKDCRIINSTSLPYNFKLIKFMSLPISDGISPVRPLCDKSKFVVFSIE